MTRDGFALLAMGFTGKKTLGFKLDYIKAFNAMAKELLKNNPSCPEIEDPVAAARAWADEWERKRIAQEENGTSVGKLVSLRSRSIMNIAGTETVVMTTSGL